MTKYVIFADGADGMVQSDGTTYANARNGTGSFASVTNDLPVGQRTFGASVWQVLEIFLSWSLASIGANERITSAVTELVADGGDNGPDSHLIWYPFDWSTSVTSADFRTGAQLAALAEAGENSVAITAAGSPAKTRLGINAGLTPGGNARFVVAERNTEDNIAPSAATTVVHYRETETSGTASDPKLTIHTVANEHALVHVGHGLIELSDGSFVSLRSNGASTPTVTLEHSPTGTVFTSIATVPTGTAATQLFNGAPESGMHAYSLCRDSSNNLYVVGFQGSTRRIAVKAYIKGAGYTWTAQTLMTVAGTRDAAENFGVCALWVDSGGGVSSRGHLIAFMNNASNINFTAAAGSFFGSHRTYSLDAGVALAGTGTLLASVKDFGGEPYEFGSDARDMEYKTGVFGEPSVVVSVLKHTFWSVNVDVDGTFGTFVYGPTDATNGTPTAPTPTGETKRRIIYAAGQPWIVNDNSHGSFPTNAGNFMITGKNGTRRESATSSGSMLATNFSEPSAGWAWDTFYDPVNGKLWFYYLDSSNTRVLRRTSYSLVANSWVGDSTTASAAIGASGTTNRAIRVVKRPSSMDRILVEVANVSGAVHTLYRYLDGINASPLAPTLGDVTAFDRSVSKLFTWMFNDPDLGDVQTAYRVEITNNTTGVSAINTGKVTSSASNYTLAASALVNEVTYRWRATTWDSRDNTGLSADWQTFEVSARPTAPISSTPPTDAPSYTLTWTYAQAGSSPQAAFKVRTLSGTTVLKDSGWMLGTASSFLVTNIPSGGTTTVELTVRSAKGVESLAITQAASPTYLAPPNPIITAITRDAKGRGNVISVMNPTPAASAQLAPEYNELWRYPVPSSRSFRWGTKDLGGILSDDDGIVSTAAGVTTIVGTPALFTIGSSSLTVPAGVTRDMTVIIVFATSDGSAVLPAFSSTGTFAKIDEQTATNMRVGVYAGKGVQAGDLITPTGTVKQCHWAHIYTNVYTLDALSVVSAVRVANVATVTTPATVPAVGQKVLVVGVERTTADGTTVSSVVSTGGETVTTQSFNEEATSTDTSIYTGLFDALSTAAHQVTVTHNSGSTNGYAALIELNTTIAATYERIGTSLPVCGTYLDADTESVGGDVRYFVRAVSNAGG